MPEPSAKIGVVVIGRNEGERLVQCLKSLQGTADQVVYVDSGSSDDSVANARNLGAEVVLLDLSRPFTAARARAEGHERLEELGPAIDYVMFVDGDCEVEANWLERAAGFLDSHPDFAVVFGRRRERFPEASPYNVLADREWDTPVGEASSCGGDSMMRAKALRSVGSFDPTMIAGEEPEVCTRLRAAGWRVMRLAVPMTIHDAQITRLGQWWRRAVRSGLGYAQAWHRTRRAALAPPLYQRELIRAIAWGGLLPAGALLLGVLLHPLWTLAWPVAVAIQFGRLFLREGHHSAFLSIIGKYAELLGVLRYVGRISRGSAGGTIHYK